MLRRQKTILAILADLEAPTTPTVLVKLAFLLRHETDLSTDPAFYDFVPYKFGPFSFALYRELEALRRDGYVSGDGDRLVLAPGMRRESRLMIRELTTATQSAVRQITTQYGRTRANALLKDVYARYSWFASRTERTDLLGQSAISLPEGPTAVYTMGYQSCSVDGFFARLLRSGIRVIADVRANPISRKYGFARSSLNSIALKLGLEYRHFPGLGIPGAMRSGLKGLPSYQRLFDYYERDVICRRPMDIAELGALMRVNPTVLVCMESDARFCHRSRLAIAVSQLSGLAIRHLR